MGIRLFYTFSKQGCTIDIFDNMPAVFTLFVLTYLLTTTSHTTFPLGFSSRPLTTECLNYQMKMATPQTKRQRGALLSCAVIMLVLGSAIIITGFCFEFHEVYEKITNPTPVDIHHIMFPRTQYWLGLPLFLLAFYVLLTRFYSTSTLYIIGLILCCFLMVASLCALGLQSTMWYISLDLASTVYTLQCEDVYVDVNGEESSSPRCNCKREMHHSGAIDEYETFLSLMTCSEVKHFPAIVSALVILSIFAFFTCQATCFVYVKILRWLEPVHCGESTLRETTSQHVLLNEQST